MEDSIIKKIELETKPRIRHLTKLNFAQANFWVAILVKQGTTFKLVQNGIKFDLTIMENLR